MNSGKAWQHGQDLHPLKADRVPTQNEHRSHHKLRSLQLMFSISTVLSFHTTIQMAFNFINLFLYSLPNLFLSSYLHWFPIFNPLLHPSITILFPSPYEIYLSLLVLNLCHSMDYNLTIIDLTANSHIQSNIMPYSSF